MTERRRRPPRQRVEFLTWVLDHADPVVAEPVLREIPPAGQFVYRNILRRLGRYLGELVPSGTDRLAAPELGAILLGGAVSMELDLPLVIVKKEAKDYATANVIEGELHAGERVTVIEDVVTTGTQAIRAAEKVAAAGATVNGVVVVLDRDEGGEDRMREAGLRYVPLFRKGDLELD